MSALIFRGAAGPVHHEGCQMKTCFRPPSNGGTHAPMPVLDRVEVQLPDDPFFLAKFAKTEKSLKPGVAVAKRHFHSKLPKFGVQNVQTTRENRL
jgi:hypothetical protein